MSSPIPSHEAEPLFRSSPPVGCWGPRDRHYAEELMVQGRKSHSLFPKDRSNAIIWRKRGSPGRPPGVDSEKEEDEAAAPPARERRTAPGPGRTESRTQTWPLLEPQTVRIAFIFLSFQYIQ